VSIPHVPPPGCLLRLGQAAHWLLNLQLRNVQLTQRAPHLGEEALSVIADLQEAMLNVDQAATFVQLPEAHNVCLEVRDEVDPRQPLVLIVVPHEQDCSSTFNVDNGAVTKLHRPADP
jgi:hypothetical protein